MLATACVMPEPYSTRRIRQARKPPNAEVRHGDLVHPCSQHFAYSKQNRVCPLPRPAGPCVRARSPARAAAVPRKARRAGIFVAHAHLPRTPSPSGAASPPIVDGRRVVPDAAPLGLFGWMRSPMGRSISEQGCLGPRPSVISGLRHAPTLQGETAVWAWPKLNRTIRP